MVVVGVGGSHSNSMSMDAALFGDMTGSEMCECQSFRCFSFSLFSHSHLRLTKVIINIIIDLIFR